MYLDYFPEERIALQQEVLKHPELVKLLEGKSDFLEAFVEITAYCQIPLDGTFTQQEINAICDKCTRRLMFLRTGILVS